VIRRGFVVVFYSSRLSHCWEASPHWKPSCIIFWSGRPVLPPSLACTCSWAPSKSQLFFTSTICSPRALLVLLGSTCGCFWLIICTSLSLTSSMLRIGVLVSNSPLFLGSWLNFVLRGESCRWTCAYSAVDWSGNWLPCLKLWGPGRRPADWQCC
jgi:hypothetical protein